MRNCIMLFMLMGFFSVTHASTNSISVTANRPPLTAYEVYVPVGKTGQLISLMDLSQIKTKEFEKLSGKKMKFTEKVNFKIAQRQLKKNINYDGTFSSKKFERYFGLFTRISWGGLALGLFLSLIGVLIAYLITDENKSNRVRWAWIGAIISFIIWGAILI